MAVQASPFISAFPLVPRPLYSWTATNGSWDVDGGMDRRVFLATPITVASGVTLQGLDQCSGGGGQPPDAWDCSGMWRVTLAGGSLGTQPLTVLGVAAQRGDANPGYLLGPGKVKGGILGLHGNPD